MKIRKPMAIAATVATMGLASVSGLGLVSAASSTSGNDSLVDKIAQKFNLNKADVQKVFDDNKSAHKAEHQAEVSNKLQKAVDGGKLTSEQKTLIENKLSELKDKRKSTHDELEKWANDNKIDMKYLMPEHGRGPKGGGPF